MAEKRFEDEYQDVEVIDLSKYWERLKTHWKTIFRWGIAAFVIGCIVGLTTPRKYTVVSKLAPELSSAATSRLTSLASLVGMSSSVLGTTDAVYPMVYPDLVGSGEFIADLFDVPVTLVEKDDSTDMTLYEYLTEHQKKTLLWTVMSLPELVMDLFRSKDDNVIEPVDPFHFTKQQGKVVKILSKNIGASIDKKTLVVTVTVTMQDALVCAMVAQAVNETLKNYITEYRTEKAQDDCRYFEKLYEEAQNSYYKALEDYSNYSDSHQGVFLKSNMIESERLKNEASLQYQLYNSMAQQLQTAKAKVQQETPVFAELIPPTVPLKSSNSRKKTAMAFGFLGLLIGCGYVLWKYREQEENLKC